MEPELTEYDCGNLLFHRKNRIYIFSNSTLCQTSISRSYNRTWCAWEFSELQSVIQILYILFLNVNSCVFRARHRFWFKKSISYRRLKPPSTLSSCWLVWSKRFLYGYCFIVLQVSEVWCCTHRASSYNMYINQQDALNSCDYTLFSIRCSTCFGLC